MGQKPPQGINKQVPTNGKGVDPLMANFIANLTNLTKGWHLLFVFLIKFKYPFRKNYSVSHAHWQYLSCSQVLMTVATSSMCFFLRLFMMHYIVKLLLSRNRSFSKSIYLEVTNWLHGLRWGPSTGLLIFSMSTYNLCPSLVKMRRPILHRDISRIETLLRRCLLAL
jgi:hypothetical protein